MAIVCTEHIDSRRITDGKSAELIYTLRGSDLESEVLTALKTAAPETFLGLSRQPVSVEPLFIDSTNPGTCIWRGTARYGLIDRSLPATGESVIGFETTGGTQRITQSLATRAYAPTGSTAPDFKGAIGVTADSVEGVDIVVPVYQWSETHYKPDAQVTAAYRTTLRNLTGTTNLSAFQGLDAGECLFMGVSGTKRGAGDWELTFRFASSPNAANLQIGGGIIVIDQKLGWEYLWIRYADAVDTVAHAPVKRPVAAYVERVYREADFNLLGL